MRDQKERRMERKETAIQMKKWKLYTKFWELANGTAAADAKSHQSCLTLCDPINGSLTGSPVPGILQARTLRWVAISFSNA